MAQRPGEDAPGVRRADVAGQTARAGRLTHAADALHLVARDDAALFEAGQQRGRRLDVAAHLVVAAGDFAHVRTDHRRLFGRQRVVGAEGPDQPLAEAVAAPRLRGVDGHGAQGLRSHLPQLVAHVHAEGARVGDLHGHAFEFEGRGAFALQRGRDFAAGEFLDGPGEGRGVRHGAVSGDGLRKAHLPQAVRGRFEGRLDVPVLVAQRDFEVQDLLAVADEAEGPRFDDACVDRPDVDLVQRASLHRVEGVVLDRTAAVVTPGGEPQRLGPRHAVETDAVAFRDVALEGVHLRVQGCERGERRLVVVVRGVRSDQHAALGVVEQQQEETHAVARREGEIVGRMVACVGEFYAKVLVEGGVGDFGDVVQRDGGAGIVGYVVIHSDAIRSISSRKNAGCQSPSPMAAASSDSADHDSARSVAEGCSSSCRGW